MKNRLLVGMLFAAAMMFAACGGSTGAAGAAGGAGGGDSGTGTASVETLAAIPSVDLSQYDSSAASANIAAKSVKSASVSKAAKVGKAFGEDMNAVGGTSRAGCEQNMHKQEIFRMAQMAQLERCYPEAMEKVGLIAAIPTGSYAYYRIEPPDMGESQQSGMCDDIPAERTEDRARCQDEASRKGSDKVMLMRLGKIDSQLQIDMCEGTPAEQVNSSTYGAAGSLYTVSVVRINTFGGETEGGSFIVKVDIGTSGSVTDGIVTIGDNGYVSASGQMDGRFGSGNISFERAVDSSVKITGAFKGEFTDPFSDTASSFEGKAYAHTGGTPVTGCANFEFIGSPPAMRVQDMIPFNISSDDLGAFLQTFGAQLGIELTEGNYTTKKLCPNPLFDPDSFSNSVKPMVEMSGTSCERVTNSDTECFSVTNASTTTDFGTEITQVFTIIADAAAEYYPEVSIFDFSTVTSTIGTLAFTREWNCLGAFTDINFASVTQAAMMAAMEPCMAIQEKAFNNDGMGNEGQCGQGEQMNSVNEIGEGGGGEQAFGLYGGEYSRKSADGGCPTQPDSAAPPAKLFANTIDENTYCLPFNGGCDEFDISENTAIPDPAIAFDQAGSTVTRLVYTKAGDGPASAVAISFRRTQGNCVANYDIRQPEFTAGGGSFGGENGGDQPGERGFVPQPCIDAGLTAPTPEDAKACGDLCSKPGSGCRSAQ